MSEKIPKYQPEDFIVKMKLPDNVADELMEIANRHNADVFEVLRRFLKIGLLVTAIKEGRMEGRLVYRKDDGSEVELRVFDDEEPLSPIGNI